MFTTIQNSNNNYENKERTCNSIGINTALDTINIQNHGYQTGETIQYSVDGTSVDGLSTSLDYLVYSLNENLPRLAGWHTTLCYCCSFVCAWKT